MSQAEHIVIDLDGGYLVLKIQGYGKLRTQNHQHRIATLPIDWPCELEALPVLKFLGSEISATQD